MFYSAYLFLYLLQNLNLELSHTQSVQTSKLHTTINDFIEDTLFPENGPVFMQRLHEVRRRVRKSTREKIKRRFGDTYAPAINKTIETVNDPATQDPAYNDLLPTLTENPIQKINPEPQFDTNPYNKDTVQGHNETPINEYGDYQTAIQNTVQDLYETTSSSPKFDYANTTNKDNTVQENYDPPINEYADYHTAMETTVQKVDDIGDYKTVIDDINPSATETSVPNEPDEPMLPKMYDEPFSILSTLPTQGRDYPLMDGPAFNPKLYDEGNPIPTEKNFQRFNEPLYEPTFTTQNFDFTMPQTTKKRVSKFNRTVIKKMVDVFYPTELETTIETSHRTRKGGLYFIQRSRFTNPKRSQTKIQRPLDPHKPKPDALMKKTTIRILNRPLNDGAFTQTEQQNPKTQDKTIQRFNEPLINIPELIQKHYAIPPQIEAETQRLDGPLKQEQKLEPKVSEVTPVLETTDFVQNYDLDSLTTETKSRKHKPKFKKITNVSYPQKTETTIQKFNKPLRNGPDIQLEVDNVSYPTTLKTGPFFTQTFDVKIRPTDQIIYRTPPFPNASLLSFENSFTNSYPTLSSNLASKDSPEMTDMRLTSSAHILYTATRNPFNTAESGFVYPWIKTAYLPGTNLAPTVSYSPSTELKYPWAPAEAFPESNTEISISFPSTTMSIEYQDFNPDILRVRAPESTHWKQEAFTIVAEPTQDPIVAEKQTQDNQFMDERHNPKQEYPALYERLKTKQENQALAERLKPKPHVQVLDERLKPKPHVQVFDERLESKQILEPATDVQEGEGTEPFSTFLSKLLKVLASKSLRELENLLQPFERYVTELVDTGKLMKLGVTTGSFIAQSTSLLHGPIKEIKRYIFIGQISLENRHHMLDEITNAMLNEMDDMYDASEEEAMQRVYNEIKLYPNTSRNEEQIIKDFVDNIFVHPMHRVAGTTKGNEVFENIGKFANKYIITYARRNEKHGAFSVGKDLKKVNKGKILIKTDFSTRFIKGKGGGTKLKALSYSRNKTEDRRRNDKNRVEIRIRINVENVQKLLKSGRTKKENLKRYAKINTKKVNKQFTSVENSESEKSKIEVFASSETENEEENGPTINR